MKKGVLGMLCVFLLLILSGFIFAAEATEQEKITKAYSCLDGKVEAQTCALLQQDQRAFVNLAFEKQDTPKCVNESMNDMSVDGCWPSAGCNVKTTAQTLLALRNKIDINKTVAWLDSKKQIPTELDWFLEIDEVASSDGMSCQISSASMPSATVKFGADKKIQTVGTTGLSPCLSTAQQGYWLKVSQTCYSEEFTIKCDKSFLTTLLYKKLGGQTIHVSEASHKADAQSTTTEKIDSYCFGPSANTCDYEATLWSALALQWVGQDVHSYLPYLIALSDDNQEFFPQTFLYLITAQTDFKLSILDHQDGLGFFIGELGHDKFYDSALGELAFSGDDQKAKQWLLANQDTFSDNEGCWNSGHVLDTAFILWATWGDFDFTGSNKECTTNDDCIGEEVCIDGKCVSEENKCTVDSDCAFGETCEGGICVQDDSASCEGNGNYCITPTQCEDALGQHLNSFDLTCDSGFDICCSKPAVQKSCAELSGNVCTSNQICAGTVDSSAAGLQFGQVCCIGGSCTTQPEGEGNSCRSNGGRCSLTGCESTEDENPAYTCQYSSDTCCVPKPTEKKSSFLWLWVLLILIVLVVLGILFRDTLRGLWMKMSKGKGGPSSPSYPSSGPRRMMPPSSPPNRPTLIKRPSSEVDDVLKKLKGMSR